ncbi:MAG: hypothetical protein DCC67_17475 [Planctomycetota bacterium]|nr:MAG: hypothetical protein DCC67_17475 [Planctomycetota bacterium]
MPPDTQPAQPPLEPRSRPAGSFGISPKRRPRKTLRARQKLGKYIIERKLDEGGFAVVYQARDEIEGIRVALKIPHVHLLTSAAMEDFRREVRLVAQLEHPNILPLRTAQFIDDHFVIVSALGLTTLEERISRRLPIDLALDFARQMLSAVAYAHSQRIIHCDIKPDNFILFEGNRLRLTDFGVAKVAQRTLRGSGAGTLGYMAPEQAMGRPSFRSDVFALGLVLYRMFSDGAGAGATIRRRPGDVGGVHAHQIAARRTERGEAFDQELAAEHRLEDHSAAAVPARVRQIARDQARLPGVPWTRVRAHAVLPVVR